MSEKVHWKGTLASVQPRIRLHRSFDERSHSYLGYVLVVHGNIDGVDDTFAVAIGKAAQEKHQFRVGDQVQGQSQHVEDPRIETAEYYKTSGLQRIGPAPLEERPSPPWTGLAPDLEVYRERGHRRLSAATFETKCRSCIWACRMAVEMTIDQWNPGRKRYRYETFCYGPKSCRLYKAGPTRKVPGRQGMSWEEADWVDEDATAHREREE